MIVRLDAQEVKLAAHKSEVHRELRINTVYDNM
jgi:hypothetical protein